MFHAYLGKLSYLLAVRVRGEQSVFRRLAQLRELQERSAPDIQRLQTVLLARTLQHAIEFVPYYRSQTSRRRIDTDSALSELQKMAVLDKEVLQGQAHLLRAEGWTGRFATKTTGGSTGRPVTIVKTPDAIAQEMAATWFGYGWFGVRIGDPCIRFWGQPSRNLKRRIRYRAADIAVNRTTLSAFGYSRADLDRYLARIERTRPAYLYGYVSALEDLARFARDEDRRLRGSSLKVVITTSEVLTAPQREVIEDAFGVPVQNEYGCGEVGPIAYQCTRGSLHLLPTNQYIEIVDDGGNAVAPGEPGHILITDLTNDVMPLIRYRVGDLGFLGTGCPCGHPFPVLGEVLGREYDYVETRDGRRYHGEFFMYMFEDLRQGHPQIGQFQVVQTAVDRLQVRVVLNDQERSSSAVAAIMAEVNRRLPEVSCSVDIVSDLPRRPSGKMRVVENRVS